nr:MAG TPA: hypothetical protein [Bacteriophage sp.]
MCQYHLICRRSYFSVMVHSLNLRSGKPPHVISGEVG